MLYMPNRYQTRAAATFIDFILERARGGGTRAELALLFGLNFLASIMPTSRTPLRSTSSSRGGACAARLPFDVVLGPYDLAVEFRAKARMSDRRRLACVNLSDGRIELRQDLGGLKLAAGFSRLHHSPRPLQQGLPGRLRRRGLHAQPGDRAGRVRAAQSPRLAVVQPAAVQAPARQRRLRPRRARRRVAAAGDAQARAGRRPSGPACAASARPSAATRSAGISMPSARPSSIAGSAGPNLAVVALHEITHAVHHAYSLESGAPRITTSAPGSSRAGSASCGTAPAHGAGWRG